MQIIFSPDIAALEGLLIIGVFNDLELSAAAKKIDQRVDGLVMQALQNGAFKGKLGQTLSVFGPKKGDIQRILVLGLGEKEKISEKALLHAGGALMSTIIDWGHEKAFIYLDSVASKDFPNKKAVPLIAQGALLRSWRFTRYKTKKPEENLPKLDQLVFLSSESDMLAEQFQPLQAVAEGVFLTRELMNEPPNVMTPLKVAECAKELKKYGIDIDILDEKQMKKLGMNALLGVGQGSENDSYVVVMKWQGGKKDDKPLAFVGKGVTFDTGGISLKPSASMDEMKFDMGGAAAVMGLMKSLALRKAGVNVVGVIGLAENMPDGKAQRPGDIVTSLSGQTIEILNTDAEGRLILADLLWYTQDKFRPQCMVNLATLTGAILVTLGHEYAGLFASDDTLAQRLSTVGEKVDELVWRLPLSEAFDRLIDSKVADMQNIGGRYAGSITAAQFLQRFTNNVPWAHLDIAGVAWQMNKDRPLSSQPVTGFGVRLLDRFIQEYYEK